VPRTTIPLDFSARPALRGIVLGVTCNIFPAGRFNASIRSARGAAIGFAPARKVQSFAVTVARRCTMCRRPSVRGCGFARARWEPTAPCGGPGNFLSWHRLRRKHSAVAIG